MNLVVFAVALPTYVDYDLFNGLLHRKVSRKLDGQLLGPVSGWRPT